MTIQLPEDLERYLQDEVQGGEFASPDEAIVECSAAAGRVRRKRDFIGKAIKVDELNQQLLDAGLLSHLPARIDPDELRGISLPSSVEGEPSFRYDNPRAAAEVAVYFFDSSAIVKRDVQEPGTGWFQALAHPRAGNLTIWPTSPGSKSSPPSGRCGGLVPSPRRTQAASLALVFVVTSSQEHPRHRDHWFGLGPMPCGWQMFANCEPMTPFNWPPPAN